MPGKYKEKLMAAILVLALIITAALPINAMNEIQESGESTINTLNEQTDDGNGEEAISDSSDESGISEEEAEDTDNVLEENPEEEQTDSESEEQEEDGSVEVITGPESEETEPEETFSESPEVSDEADPLFLDENTVQAVADTADVVTAPDWVGNPGRANEWQIVSEEYTGRKQENKKGYDIDKDGSDDLYYQKNVIPTDVENEFRVYMSITKKMTWDELLEESDFAVTSANNWHKVAIGTRTSSINGNHDIIHPGKATGSGKNYEAVVNYTRNGQVIHTYRGWYHGDTPNCARGTGFIWMKSLGVYLVASHSVDLGNGGNQLTYTVDLDEMAKQNIHFGVDEISTDSVQDTMGEYITYEGIENCDGTVSFQEDTITWKPTSNGAEGVEVVQNGGLTGFYYNIHQLVYKVHLKAEQEGFQSCAQNQNSKVGDPESYKVNKQAVLNCHMGSNTGNLEFQVPYVRGLLYDLEFQKIIKDSKISLSEITFSITRQQNGNTIAEQLVASAQEKTGSDGWLKFHDLPWGIYTLQELAGTEDSFQSDYLDRGELSGTHTVQIGKVINASALSQDHGSGHSADRKSDLKNMLVLYNGNGIFENTPNMAKITIRKIVNEYESISSTLKDQSYSIKTESSGAKDIYLKQKTGDTMLNRLEQQEEKLKHGETVQYELVVPESGGALNLEEVIPEALKDTVVFGSVKVEKNDESTEMGNITTTLRGCKLTVLPGNDLTVTVTNIPVGKVRIQKQIDNYRPELAEDAFIIRARSSEDGGQAVNVETVLKHQETSEIIRVRKAETLNIEEILPKEYSISQITLSGGGTLNGNQVTVQPGENVVITVHNTYSGKPFFHAADAIRNIFSWK